MLPTAVPALQKPPFPKLLPALRWHSSLGRAHSHGWVFNTDCSMHGSASLFTGNSWVVCGQQPPSHKRQEEGRWRCPWELRGRIWSGFQGVSTARVSIWVSSLCIHILQVSSWACSLEEKHQADPHLHLALSAPLDPPGLYPDWHTAAWFQVIKQKAHRPIGQNLVFPLDTDGMAPLGHLGPQYRVIDFSAGPTTFTYKRAQKSTCPQGSCSFSQGSGQLWECTHLRRQRAFRWWWGGATWCYRTLLSGGPGVGGEMKVVPCSPASSRCMASRYLSCSLPPLRIFRSKCCN